jgi:hypothetical protein
MHKPPKEGNFSDEHANALKPTIVEIYKTYMG